MAKNYSTPGITLVETDISQRVAPTGTSVGVMVGEGAKGIANSRILVSTDKEVIEKFGEPNSNRTKDFGIYGALQYMQESDSLYYTRATNGDEVFANRYSPSITVTSGSYSATGSLTTLTAQGSSAFTANSWEANEDDDIYEYENFSVGAETSAGALLVGAIGPGVYGNNIGITIHTSASYSSAASANDCDWAYTYDDPTSAGAPATDADAIWKKVFKVNVFVRVKSTDSFPTTPEETFYGTIGDVLAPDGSQLNVEQVVNGVSKHIYLKAVGASFTSGLPKEITTATALSNGADSSSQLDESNVSNAWDFYTDKEKVSMNILANTFYDEVVNAKIASIVNSRKDCIGTVHVGAVTEFDVNDLIDEGNLQAYASPSHVAKYVGWSLVYDSFNDKKVFIPNSLFGATIMARTDNVANVWNAPAGINRGILPVLGQNVKFNDTQIGNLYDNNLNTVKFIKGQGSVLWGQRTAQRTVSALREIAVRRMLLFVEGTIEPGLLPFIFEPNNESVRLRIFSIIDSFLSTVRAGGGMDDYRVVVDETNNTAQDVDNNLLNVDIYIQPTRTIEFIRLQMIITRSGVSLAEVTV
jgi:hypothetical protein